LRPLVVDSSVAVKWVISEDGTDDAIRLRSGFQLSAPELLLPECANVLWKKTQRGDITPDQSLLFAKVLSQAEVELVSMKSLFEDSLRLANDLGHPAYDCAYIALALDRKCPFVTADQRLVRAVRRSGRKDVEGILVSLPEIAARFQG